MERCPAGLEQLTTDRAEPHGKTFCRSLVAVGFLEAVRGFDLFLVTDMTARVKMLSVSTAKADFSGIARNVVRSQKPVIVRIPTGFIQIAPYELPEVVPAFPRGSLDLLPREVDLHNTFGESL